MSAVPAAIPVTRPETLTVAVPGDALLHVPPGVPSDRLAVPPAHIVIGPPGVIADGRPLTVTSAVL